MYKSDKGYGTAEALIAVSSLFIVLGMFIPMVISIISALEKKENNLTAARVLYEHVEEVVFSGGAESDRYERMGNVYQVTSITSEGGLCIHYKDYSGKNMSRCLREGVGE
ncbi:hypothetical protein V1502_14455 [Bacillus sp. SCS-153A]|uniref:hypothetical protein n=1 Tax=Rossellomorea sedimentorum TaxID=3115294 RepID=UPI003906C1FF